MRLTFKSVDFAESRFSEMWWASRSQLKARIETDCPPAEPLCNHTASPTQHVDFQIAALCNRISSLQILCLCLCL